MPRVFSLPPWALHGQMVRYVGGYNHGPAPNDTGRIADIDSSYVYVETRIGRTFWKYDLFPNCWVPIDLPRKAPVAKKPNGPRTSWERLLDEPAF